jgi:NAD(P)-dependent dehydrogenase (short-subunit alcohol dehydrogenase family)
MTSRGVRLAGKVAIVTGGARGIGLATVHELARRGARVLICDNGVSVEGYPEDPHLAERMAKELCEAGLDVLALSSDISTVEGAEQAVSHVLGQWGELDIVVCNAGTLRIRSVWDMSKDDWDSVLNSHLTHTYTMASAAFRWWRSKSQDLPVRGRVINLIAATGLTGRPDMGINHAAAKGAVAAFTMVAAQEMYECGVTVNAVSPAAVRTRMADHVSANLPPPSNGNDLHGAENVAPLIAYLASDEADWITGQVFRLVGGSISLYQPWSVSATITSDRPWQADNMDLRIRRLMNVYPRS